MNLRDIPTLAIVVTAVAAVTSAVAAVHDSWGEDSPPPSFAELEGSIVNDVLIAKNDLRDLSRTELRRLRNAAFARHGMTFEPSLQKYFDQKAWYPRGKAYNRDSVTKIDWKNAAIIEAVERCGCKR